MMRSKYKDHSQSCVPIFLHWSDFMIEKQSFLKWFNHWKSLHFIMNGRGPWIKKWDSYLTCIEGRGHERHLQYLIIKRGNCSSIVKYLSSGRILKVKVKKNRYVTMVNLHISLNNELSITYCPMRTLHISLTDENYLFLIDKCIYLTNKGPPYIIDYLNSLSLID